MPMSWTSRDSGLEAAQGTTLVEPFYWDLNDSTRAWTKRFNAIYKTSYPTLHHAGMYASVLHYLRALKAAGRVTATRWWRR